MSKTFDKLQPYMERAMAIHTAMTLFEWDNETLAPKEAGPLTARVIGTLSEEYMEILTCGEVKKLLARCAKEEGLTGREKAIVRELREENEKLAVIPPEEYGDFARLKAEAASVWAKAKANSDFSAFAPTLRKIVDYSKKFASYRAKKG